MITSLKNKSKEQLLAEFDAVFGDYNITPQKPTTCRRVCLGGERVYIILPIEVKTQQVLADLGRSLGERYLLIVSSLYIRGLYRKRSINPLGNFLRAHSRILRRIGGERYAYLLEYGLTNKHIAKSPLNYRRDEKANEYMLDQNTFSLKSQQRYELTTKHAIRVRTDEAIKNKAEYIKEGPAYRKIAASIDELKFNYEAAMKFVSGLPDGDHKIRRKHIIEQLVFDGAIWSIDQQKRNYTIMVVVPRDIRRFFYYGKEVLWVVDISSSQPMLHALLYPGDSPEQKRYQAIVEDGRFWDFMNEAAGSKIDLDDPDQKSEFKIQLFREVFFSYPNPKTEDKKPYAVIFRTKFPILWAAMNASKRQQKRKASAPLAKAMQKTEAEAVKDAVLALKDKPYPLITIHDAIVTTKDGLADVEQALCQSFSTANIKPRLVVKRLTA